MVLELNDEILAVVRLESSAPIPAWALECAFFSVTKTPDELSIVCSQIRVPEGVRSERNWRCLKVRGPLDFALTGILARACQTLIGAGHEIIGE